jgi:hypothetical protein
MAMRWLSNRLKVPRTGSRLAVDLAPRHAFYDWCNEVLAEAEFDATVEMLCQPYYKDGIGRPRPFPRVAPHAVPDHSTLSVMRSRLPLDIHHAVFGFLLEIANQTIWSALSGLGSTPRPRRPMPRRCIGMELSEIFIPRMCTQKNEEPSFFDAD